MVWKKNTTPEIEKIEKEGKEIVAKKKYVNKGNSKTVEYTDGFEDN